MKLIPLTQGKFAKVDDEDYEKASQYKWHYTTLGYAATWQIGKGRRITLMHRFIVGTPRGKLTDHENHDRVDNRKSNLRICDASSNLANKQKELGTSSKYINVSFHRQRKKWRAKVKQYHVGLFENEHHAALAADMWGLFFHKEFANTNFKVIGWK